MRGDSRRRVAALLVPCALAMACDCGDTALLRPPRKDVVVQAHGGVSCSGERVQLRAVVYGGKAPFHFRWEPAEGLDDPTSDAPMAEPGTGRDYTVTVTDSQSVEVTSRAVVVRGSPPEPVLDFTQGSENSCAGETVALDASRTVDHRGLAMKSYVWKVGDAPPREGADATSGGFVPRDGEVVALTVRDATGCEATVERTLHVRALPRVEVDFAEGGPFVCAGAEARLEALATDADGRPVAHAEWDLDGDRNTVDAVGTSSGRFVPNGARARFLARDRAGCTTTVETPIEVGPLPKAALRFTQGAADVCEGTRVTLDASASTDALGQPVAAFAWDLDGVASTVESTDAQPPQLVALGDRDVRLTVTDVRGCRADLTQHLRGRPLPHLDIAFLQGRENVCRGERVQVSAAGSRDADGQAVASYEWDLNLDGRVDSRDATPAAWTPAGSQMLRLTVRDAVGCVATATQPVTPRALPTPRIAFTSGAASSCDGDEVALDGSASTDADGNVPLLFSWDLDGNPATDEATGTTSGAFAPTSAAATLKVVDAYGCTTRLAQPLEVKRRPVAALQFTQGSDRVCAGDLVQVDASPSHDGSGLPVAHLEWDLDGDPATAESTAWTPNAWSPTDGRPVTLTVWGANGCSDRRSVDLHARTLPTARLAFVEGRADSCLGDAVALTASDSTDAEGNPVDHFDWELADAPPLGSTTATTPEFVPGASQTARVTVRDAAGCAATATLALTPRALPIARVRFTSGSAELCAGQEAALDASESVDADGAPLTSFAWDLDGDATTVESFGAASGTWRPDGTAARLTLLDRFGCRSTSEHAIDVGGLPVARITQVEGSGRVCAGEQVAFDASASTTASGGPVARVAWDYDGTPGTDATSPRTPSFAPSGTQQVRLTVFDARGCASGTDASATVTSLPLPQPRISFVDGAARICAGASVAVSAAGSTDAEGAPVSRLAWTFRAGASTVESSAVQPAPFVPASLVNATLRVWDANDCSAAVSQAIAPRALPELNVAFVQGRANACRGDAVSLSAEASRDTDGNALAGYAWDLDGDGADDTLLGLTPAVPLESARTVRVRGVDAEGCTGERTVALSPRSPPTPDVAFVSGAATLCTGDAVELTAAGSRDADGQPVASYLWNIEGSTRTTPATGSFAPTATPASLTVVDAQGCRANTTQAFDVGALPSARIDFAQGGALVCAGEQVALDGSGSRNAAGGTVARYEWDLDGNAATVESTAATPGAITPDGLRTARLTVFDARGCRASASRGFASRAPPTARITYEQGRADVCLGDAVRLTAATSTDADGNPASAFAWDLDANGALDVTTPSSGAFTPDGARVARLTVTDAMGCSGSATENIAPRALPRARINYVLGDATVCAGDRVQLDAVASSDADGAALQQFAWDLDSNGTTDETTPTTTAWTPAGANTATLRVTDRLGCTSTATAPVNVRALPTPRITFAQGSALACPNAPIALDGSTSTDADAAAPAAYAWDLDGNGSFEATGVRPAAFALGGARTAALRVSDGRGCTATATQELAIRTPPTARAGADRPLCPGASVALGATAEPGLRYAWSPSAGLDDPTSATPSASPTAPATYTLTVTDAAGCTSTDEVALRLHPAPVADAGPDREVTPGASVRLLGAAYGGAPGYSYAWSNAATLDDARIAEPRATPTNHTTYELAVTDANTCRATDLVQVRMVSALVVDAGVDQALCLDGGSAVPLAGSATGGVGGLRWQWTASPACGGCIATPTAPTTTVSPTQPTTFTLTVTDENGASASDAVAVNVLPRPDVNAGADRRLRPGESTQLGASPVPGLTYTWSCNQGACGLSDPTAADPIATPRGTTAYRVTATDGRTCTGSDLVLVSTEAQVLAAMPTEGFSPWPRDAPLWVVFDTDIDPASLAGNVQLLDPSDGRNVWIRVTYDAANRMLIIEPLTSCGAGCSGGDEAYSNNNQYLLVLKGGPGGVRTAGPLPEPLYADLTLEFNVSSMGDGTDPVIVHRRPLSGATNVAPSTHVVVQFADHVDPRTVNATTLYIDGVASTVTYDIHTKTAYLRPQTSLQAARTYVVRVNGVVDARSSPSRQNRLFTNWSFTTGIIADRMPPRALSFAPADGTVSYDVGGALSVRFDEPLDVWTVAQLRLIDEATRFPVFADVHWEDATLTARFVPRGFLDPLASYRIEASDVTDHAGNRMTRMQASRFTTNRALLFERFEGGTVGWSLDTGWGTDFQATYAGWWGLSDSPGGNAPSGASRSARTPALDVTGRTSVTLSYWARRTISTDADRAYVEYSSDGVTWTAAATLTGSTGWRLANHVLPTNGQPRLHVRFRHTTNASVNLDGWFLDEMVVR